MASVIPNVVGDVANTKATPVMLVDTAGNPQGGAGAVAQQLQGNVAGAATDSGNPVKIGAVYNSSLPTYTTGQRTDAQSDVNGNLRVSLTAAATAALDGATNTLAYVSAANGQSAVVRPLAVGGFRYNGTTWDRDRKPSAASRILSAAASTNATSAKASAGDLHKVVGLSARGSTCFLKIYNKASAPTVGTDTPVLTIPIPATAAFEIDFGGQYFSLGIAYAFTTAVADADTGALTAADILGFNLTYA